MPSAPGVRISFRAVGRQQLAAFDAHHVRHRQHQLVALGRRDQRQRDAGVAARRFQQHGICMDLPGGLGGLNHAGPDAVLDAGAGLKLSSLSTIRPGNPAPRRPSCTNGVLPIVSMMFFANSAHGVS